MQYPNPAGLKRVRVDRYSRTVYDRVPEPPPKGPRGADRITILDDFGPNGRARRAKDFVGGLNLATGIAFGHATEVTLGSREVPTAEVFLGETEIALGAVARRWRCNGTRLNRTGRSQTAGRGRIIVRWRRAFLGRTAIRIQEIAEIGRSSAAGEHEQAGKCDKVSTRSRSHRCIPRRTLLSRKTYGRRTLGRPALPASLRLQLKRSTHECEKAARTPSNL